MSINLKKVPNTPGVYKFFSKHEIIYIGKAKNLKKKGLILLWKISQRQKDFAD